MGKASLINTNFTGGELSPAIALGRVDIAKYNNGVRRLENCSLTVQGGAKRRPGTRYITTAGYPDRKCRLIEFVFNRGQAYVLEMGDGYIRFFKDRAPILSGGVPYQLGSPYSEGQLPAATYVQKSDTAFFAHEAVYPQRLQRYSDAQWSMLNVPFLTEPFEEQGHYLPIALTLGSAAIGSTSATATSAWLKADVGRYISYGGGYARITGYTSASVVTVQITSPFPTTALPAGGWNLEGSPQDDIAPSNVGRVGQLVSLNADFTYFDPDKTLTGFIGGSGNAFVTVAAHGYVVGDTVQVQIANALMTGVVTEVQSPNVFGIVSPDIIGGLYASGATRKLQISNGSEIWRASDVGKFVSLNGGLIRITQIVSVATANGEVLRPMTSAVPAGPNAWSLESAAWAAPKGYPRAVTINRQRLMFAGSPGYPQNLWSSSIQAYLSFQFGTNDDDAFRFELDGPRNSPIKHLAPARQLLVLTESDEMSLKGGQEKPITPTNIQKTDESTTGASQVRPVKIGNEMLFVQAAGKKVSALGYRYEIDGFASPDRTVFSAHITGPGVVQLAHQKEPDSTLYAVRSDGVLAVCAYDIEQEVTGWGRWLTQGSFESVATVPTPTGEDAYAVVARTVSGGIRRYVEVFDADMLVDCGVSGFNPSGQTTWTGLSHLEGMKVQAWGDGAYQGEFTVTGGAITLPITVFSVQIGLGFTPLVDMLPPEVGGNGTTAQGSQVHCNEVIIRVLDTSAAVINGQPIEFRTFGDHLLDLPPPAFTGDVRTTTLSDTIYTTSQVITQPYPLPFHLLDVIRRVTINEG